MHPTPAPVVRPARGTTGRRGVGVIGTAALAGDYADDLLLATARDVHGAFARRMFGLTGYLSGGSTRRPQAVHDTLYGTLYRGISVSLRVAAAGLRAVERRGVGPALEDTSRGRLVLSAVNGFLGDRLAEERPEFAIPLAVRAHGHDVPLDAKHLAAAFPDATGDVVVFLHGLGENDESWNRGRDEHGGTYGSRLLAETSWTPVYLRANTGLPIAENGVALAALLQQLVTSWPTEVRRIALVGHSMGGLILRSACAVRTDEESPWTDRVTDVVTLGSPHLGAPLERTVSVGARALGVLPESAPFGRILDYRSRGILNLRHGLAADVQHLPHARYHLVAATLTRSHRHPVSEVLGDLLVRYPSAVGRPRRGPEMFPGADILHVPATGHLALLNHPDVSAALRGWLR